MKDDIKRKLTYSVFYGEREYEYVVQWNKDLSMRITCLDKYGDVVYHIAFADEVEVRQLKNILTNIEYDFFRNK